MSRHHDRIKNDPRWKAARTACLERDGHMCIVPGCGATENLEADHIKELADYPELAYEISNLRTLCRHHHERRDDILPPNIERNRWINPKWLDILDPHVPVLRD